MIYIYALVDPRDNRVRYIGKSVNPQKRYKQHCEHKSRLHRSVWIQGILKDGLKPILKILEELPDDANWQQSERDWIAYGKSIGWDLTNRTDGGDGVVNMPPESRARMLKTWVGRKHKPESIAKISQTRRGMYNEIFTQEYKEKMSIAMKGRVISDETKEKMSVAAKKSFEDPVLRSRIAAYRRKLTDSQVFEILDLIKAGYKQVTIAKQFNVSPDTICGIKQGRYYAHIGKLIMRIYDFYQNQYVLYSPSQKMVIPDWLQSRGY